MKTQLSFAELFAIIQEKIANQEVGSYSSTLALEGIPKITRKIGEEAIEVVIAAFLNDKNNDEKSREELIGEVCDLFYHTLILLAAKGINLDLILQEFARRNNKINKK